MIKDYSFNRVSLLVDGVNGQLSDIDFYDGVRKVVNGLYAFNFDITSSNYFRKNPFLTSSISAMSYISGGYLSILESFMDGIEMKFNHKGGSLTNLLEVMKNSLFGRLQHPHPYFIEKGVHSITILSNNDSKKK